VEGCDLLLNHLGDEEQTTIKVNWEILGMVQCNMGALGYEV
jgi:hypothetical protein